MIIQQFFTPGIAHSSYLMGGQNHCAIIDPRRDVQIYLDAAKELNMEITHIFETHLHADFISGHLDLADITGAKIYVPKSADCSFDHDGLEEGDEVQMNEILIRVLQTPGHTPEHVSYFVIDTARGDTPVGVFCGDTLFVGDVGRPDLFPGMAEDLADQLYHSLHDKLLALPDECEVYPAHGAGSLCGRAMGAKRRTTIGYERKHNPALVIADKKEFIRSLTSDMPPAPDHFSRCSQINAAGPVRARKLPPPKGISTEEAVMKMGKYTVLDIRGYESFGSMHVPGAYHIDLSGNFATFAGWILPPKKPVLIVSDTPSQADEAAIWLRRVGVDDIAGTLDGGMFDWALQGNETGHILQVSAPETHAMLNGPDPVTLLDVRGRVEYDKFHIENSIHIPVQDLRTEYARLDDSAPILILCGGGQRSSLAASILEQKGFKNLYNVAGGMSGYRAAGYVPVCPMCQAPHGPRFLGYTEPGSVEK